MKSVRSLIKLTRAARDEKQRVLLAQEAEAARLHSALEDLRADHARERAVAAADFEAGRVYPAYQKAVKLRETRLKQQIRDQEGRVERARADVSVAHQEVRKYELAKEAQDRRDQAERDRREQIELDEIGLTLTRRRTSDPASPL